MARTTGLLYDERFLDHDTGTAHVERPERLAAIVQHLWDVKLWEELEHLPFQSAVEENLLTVHTPRHVDFVKTAYAKGITVLDGNDTTIGCESYEVALRAAGCALAAIDAVMESRVQNAFCLLRPPGHHAESDAPMGFCLFNNVAMGARNAQQNFGLEKVAIVDWDVHHGNGTQEIFYRDPSVLYISTHQYPLYPGTGSRGEQGEGPGYGFTLNYPMFPGAGEKEFLRVFGKEILPALDAFQPELLLISAGFDAHRDDPLANLNLTEESFGIFTEMMIETAAKHCNGKIVSILEGGYNLSALARCVETHVRRLSGIQ